MFKAVLGCGLALALGGCAQSSGVLKMGPDTYTVSIHAAPARGGQSGAKKLAYAEAAEHCAKMGREMLVANTYSGESSHLPGGTVDLNFQCLAKGDRDLRRPTYASEPAIVIQKR